MSYTHEYYLENQERIRQNLRDRQQRNREFVAEVKSEMSCSRCGYNDNPHHLHFHHRDPATKDRTISSSVTVGWGIDRIQSEMDKCDLLCADCHQEIHKEMRQHSSVV